MLRLAAAVSYTEVVNKRCRNGHLPWCVVLNVFAHGAAVYFVQTHTERPPKCLDPILVSGSSRPLLQAFQFIKGQSTVYTSFLQIPF